MKELKVSAVSALAVTLLAVITAITFSIASFSYYREVQVLKKTNAQYRESLKEYRQALDGIKKYLASVSDR